MRADILTYSALMLLHMIRYFIAWPCSVLLSIGCMVTTFTRSSAHIFHGGTLVDPPCSLLRRGFGDVSVTWPSEQPRTPPFHLCSWRSADSR